MTSQLAICINSLATMTPNLALSKHDLIQSMINPWARDRRAIELKKDDNVVLAARKDESCDLVRVLTFLEGDEAAAKTTRVHEICHG